MRGDAIGLVRAQPVVPARDDHEPGTADGLLEVAADGRWAGPVSATPQQKRRDVELVQPRLKLGFGLKNPAGGIRVRIEELRAPVLGAERRDVDTAGCRGQHEMGDQAGHSERQLDGDDASHRLRDDDRGRGEFSVCQVDEIGKAPDMRVRSLVAKPGPGQEAFFPCGRQVLPGPVPERGVAAGPGKKQDAV